MKISPSKLKTILTIGENLNIEFKQAGDGPKADTFESVCAFLNTANFFHQIQLADELGSGVRNLYKYVRIYSGALPIFDEGDIFRLTVPLNAEHSPEATDTPNSTRKTTEKGGKKTVEKTVEKTVVETVEKTVEKILKFLEANPSATQEEIVSVTGLSRRGVEWNLKELKKSGRIRRVGPDKGGHWEVIE